MAKVRKITIEMCEEKIADLDAENQALREQLDGQCVGLTTQQTVQLIAVLHGTRQYVKDHLCPGHFEFAQDLLKDTEDICEWFTDKAVAKVGNDSLEEVALQDEADRLLASMPHDAPQN